MTIVGPRPCLPSQRTLIEARENNNIFAYTPGITGISQLLNIMMDNLSYKLKLTAYMEIKNLKIFIFICIALLTQFLKLIVILNT